MGHRSGDLGRCRSSHPRTSDRTGSGKSESRLCRDSPNRTPEKHVRTIRFPTRSAKTLTEPMRVGDDARFEVAHTGRGKPLDSALVSA